jgi:hypothetical protein
MVEEWPPPPVGVDGLPRLYPSPPTDSGDFGEGRRRLGELCWGFAPESPRGVGRGGRLGAPIDFLSGSNLGR